jgi:predicted peptidase
MVHRLFLSMAALSLASIVVAQVPESSARPASDPQQTHTLQTNVPHAVRMQYLLFVPIDYDKGTETWPLILYLHGGSLRGDDIRLMTRWGLAEKIEKEPNFPFIVVSPQCHKGEIWTDVDALAAVLDEVCRTHRVDPDRIYITGHSMGGRGALYAAYRMPERFAAVLSLAPVSLITDWANKLAQVPLWVFHGPQDQFTPLKEVEELVHAVTAAGGRAQLTILPKRDHYILDVYERADVYEWLGHQTRSHSARSK